MRRVLLVMEKKALAQGIMGILARRAVPFHDEADYLQMVERVRQEAVETVLIEVSENEGHDIDYCLGACEHLRMEVPECRILLLLPEEREDFVEKTIEAKRSGLIHDFIFLSAGLEYMASSLMAL